MKVGGYVGYLTAGPYLKILKNKGIHVNPQLGWYVIVGNVIEVVLAQSNSTKIRHYGQ